MSRLFAAAVIALVRALGRGGRLAVARGLATVAFALGIRRRVTLDNLRQALPERSPAEHRRIAHGAYVTMLHGLIEAVASVRPSDEDLARLVQCDDFERLTRTLAEGKGLIIATAHFGSWELLGAITSRRGVRTNVVAKVLKGAFNAHIVEARKAAGIGLIPPRGSIAVCAAALARNEMVCLLIDQSIDAQRGVFVPFFGRLASTTPAASLLARRTGAPVLVAMAHWEGDVLRLKLEGPFPMPATGDEKADLTTHTATLTAAIEREIRAWPEQWLWLHRRWKVRPPAELPTPGGA